MTKINGSAANLRVYDGQIHTTRQATQPENTLTKASPRSGGKLSGALGDLSKFVGGYQSVLRHTTGAIPGIGGALTLTPDLVTGALAGLFRAGSSAARGDMPAAKSDLKATAQELLSTTSAASRQISNAIDMVPTEILPPQARLAVAGTQIGAQVLSSGAEIGSTALNGGDVGVATKAGVETLSNTVLGATVNLFEVPGLGKRESSKI
ncbi:hypothetical protein [Paraburkholderia humisilvae]|uniref:Uncharacterized protein n=1 Tax=Paraburkholderia humisilvae TaxID=627669 RepID=A0A6J5F921_9BURK|nr:hypothetical protein [Paraburkholderia humisilvae]CAB3774873.1 hypothetical protein LMG29542_08255 [Paraburkholderia humisilvae]